MKKLFTTVIAMVLPMLASAYHYSAEYKDDNGFFYQLNHEDHTAMITYEWSIDYIGDYTFSKSYSGNIVIPSSFVNRDDGFTYTVTGIDENAFYQCDGLTSVVIPSSVTTIGSYAFYCCTNLTSLIIPSSVTSVGGYAFDGSAWLNNQPDGIVYAGRVAYRYKGTMSVDAKLTLNDGTVGIAKGAFEGCSNLISVTIPSSVKYIGEYAFSGSGLTSVTIPEGVEYIDVCAFYGCSNLNSVIIPSSVTFIGHANFGECDNLLSVTSYITEPYSVWGPPFSENTYRKGTLTIPADTKELYSRFDGWKEFLKIVEMEDIVYNLSIQDSSNGTIDLKVKDGNTFTLKITPKDGKTIKNVLFNDADVTSQLDSKNNYTTPAITANSTLRIVYKGDKRGDLNGDDKVDVADHVELSKIIMASE